MSNTTEDELDPLQSAIFESPGLTLALFMSSPQVGRQMTMPTEQLANIGTHLYYTILSWYPSLVDEAILTELKTIWNETQPDIVPDGIYETDEAKYLRKRIVELTKSKDKEDK